MIRKTTEYAEGAEIGDYNSNYHIYFLRLFCVVCGSKHKETIRLIRLIRC